MLVHTHQNIVKLNVTMHDPILVAILQSQSKLLEYSLQFIFGHAVEEVVYIVSQV